MNLNVCPRHCHMHSEHDLTSIYYVMSVCRALLCMFACAGCICRCVVMCVCVVFVCMSGCSVHFCCLYALLLFLHVFICIILCINICCWFYSCYWPWCLLNKTWTWTWTCNRFVCNKLYYLLIAVVVFFILSINNS